MEWNFRSTRDLNGNNVSQLRQHKHNIKRTNTKDKKIITVIYNKSKRIPKILILELYIILFNVYID